MPKQTNRAPAAAAASCRIFVSLACAAPLAACQTPPASPAMDAQSNAALHTSIRHRVAIEPRTQAAKNVILFVGDGMGVATVTGARIFEGQRRGGSGEEHTLSFESFPYLALVKTYNTNQQVPDSAGTATAMVTGRKTRAGVISVKPAVLRGDCTGAVGQELESIADDAERAGKSTGIVTTTRITHATPATVYAHSSDRAFESDAYMTPEQKAKCPDIASQLLAFDQGDGLDVVLGGGKGEFVGSDLGGIRRRADDNLIAPWLAADPRRVFVETRDALAALTPADHDKQVLGLFSRSHLKYTAEREADNKQPTLNELTRKAIELLSQNDNGYFLMVEGGRIDHGHHIGKAGYAFTETEVFAATIRETLDAVDLDETLVLVTADHSHVMTLGGYPTRGNPILGLVVRNDEHGQAHAAPDTAGDGQPYASVSYANGPGYVQGPRPAPAEGVMAKQQALVRTRSRDRDGMIYDSETHGGEDVALYANGPWAHLVGGVLEQNAIYHIMRYAYGWPPKTQ